MVEKITKYKKYIISVSIILVLAILFANIKYLLPKKYEELPEVRLREIKSSKSFAIMVPNETGDGYVEYKIEDNTWPGDEYAFKEAKCVDNNGNAVENAITFESATKTAILETDKTVSCTLYFDENVNPTNFFRKYDPNNVITEEEVGGMYRYQGVGLESAVDDTHKLVDNNYICFGTDKQEECLGNEEKYMYRIIGITEDGQLYLIKMKAVEEGEDQNFQWNLRYESPDCDGDACEWPNVDIYKRLNGTESNGNPIFVNNSRYEYMQEANDWYKKIENHNWLYGDVVNISNTILDGETVYGAQNNGLILYDIETGVKPTQTYDYSKSKYVKHQWSAEKSVSSKIGLMYLHDYYLAYDNERNWYDDYDETNWLLIENNNYTTGSTVDWLISRYGGYSDGYYYAWYVFPSGNVLMETLSEYGDSYDGYAVRPTFYLTADVKIKEEGNGTKTNPFTIEI